MTDPHHPEPDQMPRDPKVEQGAVGPSATHMVVEGETPMRLPHERDESSDSGTRAPTEEMRLAAADAEAGQSDPPRGPQTQRRYSELTEDAQQEGEGAAPATQPKGSAGST
jgi:hypothetical protein